MSEESYLVYTEQQQVHGMNGYGLPPQTQQPQNKFCEDPDNMQSIHVHFQDTNAPQQQPQQTNNFGAIQRPQQQSQSQLQQPIQPTQAFNPAHQQFPNTQGQAQNNFLNVMQNQQQQAHQFKQTAAPQQQQQPQFQQTAAPQPSAPTPSPQQFQPVKSAMKRQPDAPQKMATSKSQQTKSSGHYNNMMGYEQGKTHSDKDTFETEMTITFSGDAAKFKNNDKVVIQPKHLQNIFKPQIRDYDQAFRDGTLSMSEERKKKNYGNVFIVDACVVQASNTLSGIPVSIVADSSNTERCFNRRLCVDHETPCMINLPPSSSSILTKKDKVFIVDDTEKMYNSKLYTTFGHVNIESIEHDLTFPDEYSDKAFIGVKKTSIIVKIISDSKDYFMKECHWDGKCYTTGMGYIRYPDVVVALAIRNYDVKIKPHIDPRKINMNESMIFKLVQQDGTEFKSGLSSLNTDFASGTQGIVSLTMKVRFCFPESSDPHKSFSKMSKSKIDPKQAFANLFSETYTKYENK